ncbi:putative inorganic phosphate cotransporter [Haematobia irritans]|uniref:putative inorganic phosphate cotransporter n=1 Tax=Haematobia irritans TaxID=7368 RepID=UPI003F50AEA2
MAEGESKGPFVGMRHIQTFLLFFNIVVIYISRLNIGVAVVAMTNANSTNPDFEEFEWSGKEIAYILSSFYWGYFITQFPGGSICKRFGVKSALGWSTFITALLCAAAPYCVQWQNWQALCLLRMVQGLVQGIIFPGIVQHLANWSPVEERNRLGAFSFTGIECGTVLALGSSGLIAKGSWGWPGIFYAASGICLLWTILWLILGADNACNTRFITKAEKIYIESSMTRSSDFHDKRIPTPWKAILTSVPFYALVICRCCQLYGISTMQAQIPSYLHGVLNMEIGSNAIYSSIPFLASWFTSYVYMFLGDALRNKLSLTALRRTFSSLAMWVPAVLLIALGFIHEEQKMWALVLITLTVAVNSGKTIGISLNNIDLSPNHAGILMSLTNTPASIMSLIGPLVVGFVVTDKSSRIQWQIVFAIASIVFFFGNLIYIIWGSTDTQPWNDEDYLSKKSRKSVRKGDLPELPDIAFKKPKV